MSSENTTVNSYLRTRVLTASPEELRLLLLEGAVKFARQGREALAQRHFEGAFNGISQCRNIVVELMTTMRPEHDPELCERMKALYAFMFQELTEASMAKDPARVDGVIRLLEYERETWTMLMEQLGAERGRAAPGPDGARVPGAMERAPLSVEA